MKLKLKRVRIAFCQHLHTAGAITAGDTPKFSATFLIPKSDAEQVQRISEVIKAEAVEKWRDKADGVLKALAADNKICLRNGEAKSQYDGFSDCFYIAANSKVKPLILDVDKSPLAESSGKPYAGCYVDAVVDVWAQDNQYGKRINAGLRGVRFVEDGDAFTGAGVANANDFDDIAVTSGNSVADYL
jgi:hypothetical protein